MTMVDRAATMARTLVEPLGKRWVHVQGVASRAAELSEAIAADERTTLVAAAWLHDIGYAPEVRLTGFHPLDGAHFLREGGWPTKVVNLVAHHSGARFEARERGLHEEIREFPFADSPTLDALVTADLTTGPGGERLTYDERIAEILTRYPSNDPVHRTWVKAAPILKQAVLRTEERLRKAQPK